MRVVVRLVELQAHNVCDAYLRSPFWDEGEQALVYPDWAAAVTQYMTMGISGVMRLGWMVARRLVPMTTDQFVEARKAARQ